VVSDWSTAVAPPVPELKEVTVDPAPPRCLFLDLMKAAQPPGRAAIAAVPAMKRVNEARARTHAGLVQPVARNGKATPDDVVDPAIKPRDGEWYRQGGPDKFWARRWSRKKLQAGAGIQTVIVCGNSYQGATVGTASARPSAATRSSSRSTARGGGCLQRAIRRPTIWWKGGRWWSQPGHVTRSTMIKY